jgi:hypothetical protein
MERRTEVKFKRGDKVIYKQAGNDWVGVITIVSEDMGYKVLFDDGDGPDYYYYKEEELELAPEAK